MIRAGRTLSYMVVALLALLFASGLCAGPQLRGGVSTDGEPSLAEIYADQDPLRGKPVIMPPALQGRVRKCVPPNQSWVLVRETPSTCYYFAPFPSPLRAVVVTVEDAKYRRLQGSAVGCGSHPWDRGKLLCDEEGPPLTGGVTRRTPPEAPEPGPCQVDSNRPFRPQIEALRRRPECNGGGGTPNRRPPAESAPPGYQPLGDPSYTDGIRDGFKLCGKPFETMWRAYQALEKGNAVKAAEILGATTSDAGVRFVGEALKALWNDLANTQVLDQRGRPLSELEKGRRHALRICTWALIPVASECAVAAGKCIVSPRGPAGSGAACASAEVAVIQKANPYVPKLNLPKPLSPLQRGLLLADQKLFERLAATRQKTFIIRDANPGALRWVGRPGFKPKPMDVKGKSLTRAELPPGKAGQYEGLASARGLSAAERKALTDQGYSIGSPSEFELIRDPQGNAFYSDIDLHGVYNRDGTSGWTKELEAELDCGLFDRGVMHGPHDVWSLRNNPSKAGPNYGPQIGNGKTVTAILPDGQIVRATTLAEMKQLYQAIGVDFSKIYPGF
jgi:hypothetical protein